MQFNEEHIALDYRDEPRTPQDAEKLKKVDEFLASLQTPNVILPSFSKPESVSTLEKLSKLFKIDCRKCGSHDVIYGTTIHDNHDPYERAHDFALVIKCKYCGAAFAIKHGNGYSWQDTEIDEGSNDKEI